jgi:hypothetical protein
MGYIITAFSVGRMAGNWRAPGLFGGRFERKMTNVE